MKKTQNHSLCGALCLLAAFALWTIALITIDVQPVGPEGSPVGLASLNLHMHRLTGVHLPLYQLTDWLSLAPVFLAMGFALLGLTQWICRRHLLKVDRSLLILGGFYLTVMAAYAFFEAVVINYRPVLIDGFLEASYPSSTTMLVMCVMPTAKMQLMKRMKNRFLRRVVSLAINAFTVFMVVARLISGVHWLTDIIGGALLSAGLVLLYDAFTRCASE